MSTDRYSDTLKTRGIKPFLWTQFLGAFNDNLFKTVVSLLAIHATAASDAGHQLAIVSAVFVVPFLLGSGYAGQLADIFSKRTVLIATKSMEIVAAAIGLAAFATGHLHLTYSVLFLIALQATFFSPAKYGILPEILPERDLSRANGVLEMSTFVAIVLGAALGGFLFDLSSARLWLVGVLVVALAVAGTVSSFWIPRVPVASADERFRLNPYSEIWAGMRTLGRDRVLCLSTLGISYFWFLGALLQLVTLLFGTQVMALDATHSAALNAFAAIGIGIGSIAAGRLSGNKVEPGLAPIGSIGMGVFAIALAFSRSSFALAAANLALIGFFGGLFAVPLNALLQQRSAPAERGRIMATNNFLNMAAIALASGALSLCTGTVLHMSPDHILLVFGAATLVCSIYVLALVPDFTVRFALWLLTHTIYRIRIVGQEHVPSRGPALLVCNHLSHVDGMLVGSCVQRFVRFLVYRPIYEHWALHPLLKMMKAIPISGGRDALESIERVKDELCQGHVVCVFAEGSISRTGQLLPFKRGLERMVEGLDVPVVPVYLDKVWGSIFSFKGHRFFWKLPTRVPYPVTVAFGRPLPTGLSAGEIRLALQSLGCDVATDRIGARDSLPKRFVRTAKRRWWSFAMADANTAPLSFGRVLTASLLLSRWFRRHTAGEIRIGVLLPASAGASLANLGLSIAGKVPVNLNFTIGSNALEAAIAQSRIRTVITSRRFLSKAHLDERPGMIYLEDVLGGFTVADKAGVLAASWLLPAWALNHLFVQDVESSSAATVIFSSGSTGSPKGVVLSHRNVLSNLESVAQVYEMTKCDRLVGVLPLFHSFGFTGTLWFPMIAGFGVAYHANPTDAKTVGDLAERFRATFIITTPTFCATYIRKIDPRQFATLRLAIVGAEKLRQPIADAFYERFGVRLMEGYGCTEMSPVVAANVPDVYDGREHQRGTLAGSVGHPLPGIAAMIVDPDTGEGPLFNAEGLLLVRGPNRMLGYLDDPGKTAAVFRGGWYVTGDIAVIDDAGFIRITDRLSRFSKIGGEMVPHMKVEEAIREIVGSEYSSVVTSIPDDARGERLVAFHTNEGLAAGQIWEQLCKSELPRLWLPKREDIAAIAAIPTLGTGKVDLRAVRQLALARTVEGWLQ